MRLLQSVEMLQIVEIIVSTKTLDLLKTKSFTRENVKLFIKYS